ncbi:hypothetical protein D3C85_988610 [compost metagenome]
MPPHALGAQHRRPDARQRLLDLALRRCIHLRGLGLHRRQRLAVDLAVGVQRQRRQRLDHRRHHVVRQAPPQRLAQRRRLDAQRRHVGHQPLAARRLRRGHHHRLLHARLGQQPRLDLAQLDAQPPDLHLMVQPPQVLQRPILAPAHQIPGAVQPLTLGKRVGHEALRAQRRPVQVAPGKARAAQIQLARHALRRRVQVRVQHPAHRVPDGPPDRHRPAIVFAPPVRHVDRRLGRAVQVVQRHPGQLRPQVRLRLRR